MTQYAKQTDVPASRSRDEIERTLTRYGADAFMYGWEAGSAAVMFDMQSRRIRFLISMPDPNDPEFTLTPKGKTRSPLAATRAYEQATRQRWRALALVVKAKLEAVESGIATFEQEFMAYIVLPDGMTVGQWMLPQIDQTYQTGNMPKMLPITGEEE